MNGIHTEKCEVIKCALEKINIESLDDCIMIGDRKHDIIGAKIVGMDSISVLFGYGNKGELIEAGADYIIESVNELSDLLC